MTAHCIAIHNKTLNKSFLFEKKPIWNSELELRMFSEWTSWERDSTAKHIVLPAWSPPSI